MPGDGENSAESWKDELLRLAKVENTSGAMLADFSEIQLVVPRGFSERKMGGGFKKALFEVGELIWSWLFFPEPTRRCCLGTI